MWNHSIMWAFEEHRSSEQQLQAGLSRASGNKLRKRVSAWGRHIQQWNNLRSQQGRWTHKPAVVGRLHAHMQSYGWTASCARRISSQNDVREFTGMKAVDFLLGHDDLEKDDWCQPFRLLLLNVVSIAPLQIYADEHFCTQKLINTSTLMKSVNGTPKGPKAFWGPRIDCENIC